MFEQQQIQSDCVNWIIVSDPNGERIHYTKGISDLMRSGSSFFGGDGIVMSGHAVLLSMMISINSISNYSRAIYLFAAFVSLLSIGYLFWAEKKDIIKEYHTFLRSRKNRILLLSFIFVLFPATTLLYSRNQVYGIEKLLFLILSVIPMFYYAGFLFFRSETKRKDGLLFSLLLLATLFAIVSIALQPYLPGTLYTFSPSRWSHVTAGRYLTLILPLAIWSFFSITSKEIRVLSVLAIILCSFALYQMSFRAGVLLVIIITPFIILNSIREKNFTVLKFLQSFVILGIIVTVIITTDQKVPFTEHRYEALGRLVTGETETEDGAINDRIEGASTAFQMIQESPLIGRGFGGYNTVYNNKQLPTIIKYPHNLFLEVFAELGFIYGLFFSSMILYCLIDLFRKSQTTLLLLFITLVWLSLFSKNFSSNGGVLVVSAWCFLRLRSGTIPRLRSGTIPRLRSGTGSGRKS